MNEKYCLGSGNEKCKSCANYDAWVKPNFDPDELRIVKQAHMARISDDACRLTGMSYHTPVVLSEWYEEAAPIDPDAFSSLTSGNKLP